MRALVLLTLAVLVVVLVYLGLVAAAWLWWGRR